MPIAPRHILLAISTLAIVGGIALASVQFLAPSLRRTESRGVPPVSILAATKPLSSGTLLRAEDLAWRARTDEDQGRGTLITSPASSVELTGAAIRHDLKAGESVVLEDVIRPGEVGFLAAVLANGSRAVTVPLSSISVASMSVLTPGDRVDVILIQSFAAAETRPSQRSVVETILRNIRIIAIDYGGPSPGRATAIAGRPAAPDSRQPRAITLEASANQAEALFIAIELGKIELVLRGEQHQDRPTLPTTAPTWAGDISPALEHFDRTPEARVERPTTEAPSIQIMRGGKVERLCVGPSGNVLADCGRTP